MQLLQYKVFSGPAVKGAFIYVHLFDGEGALCYEYSAEVEFPDGGDVMDQEALDKFYQGHVQAAMLRFQEDLKQKVNPLPDKACSKNA